MKSLEKHNFEELFLWIVSAGIIILFFLLNCFTPLIADDYSYSLGIYSVADIIDAQYNQWFSWGGRCVAHFLAQFWLLLGKPFFNIANTFVYCLFVILTYFHITGTVHRFNVSLFLVINIFYWFFVPAWGQNFLWLDGSCNYLWTTTIVLFFLVPFRKKNTEKSYELNTPLSVFFFIISILAGWSNENTGAAVLFLLIALLAMKIVRKEKIALFEIMGGIGFLIGFALLIGAPGNYMRVDVIKERGGGYSNEALIIMLIKRFDDVNFIFFKNHGVLVMAASLFSAFDLLYRQKRRLNLFSYFYALSALVSVYSMVLSPRFPDRAFLIVLVFALITLGNVLMQFELRVPALVKRNRVLIFCLLLPVFSSSILKASKNIMGIYIRWQNRIEYITAEKDRGNLDVEVKAPILATDRHAALYGLGDLLDNPAKWPNTSIAEYFGLNSLKGLYNEEPF
jgi:hypothetical protein